ncbi:pyrroline-5-carboxylate reductase [Caproicibacterium lactatifermentans]|jgi:pyrroline-5-carboxylate reductase|uniref:pyrroline-5-carboxylate reductase n=1 Tax=Caproicibacterium lactatifermentans TaxID=2666138 RepID=UPI003D8E85D1
MKIGFIGCGNMAKAMIAGILKNGLCAPADITVSAKTDATLEKAKAQYGVCTQQKNAAVAQVADILVLAVKPQYYEEIIREIRGCVDSSKLIITIAPGKTLSWLAEQFSGPIPIVRTMPNTPAMVGEGITAASPNEYVTPELLDTALQVLRSFGKAEVIPENLMDAVVAVSGSSPAYVFLFIEAMADAAVADGMPRSQAYTFAAQSVLGSAKMVLETGKHPGELKDMVCSPAGTTIAAVRVLEEKGLRGCVMDAMKACSDKAKSV